MSFFDRKIHGSSLVRFNISRKLNGLLEESFIIFVTAYITYALEGYKVNAVRYLLKDDECLESAVNECLETVISKINHEEIRYTFEFHEGTRELLLDNILYIESNLHKLIFHTRNSKADRYSMYEKLDVVEEQLKRHGFCRIHKSYLVNLKFVESVERYQVKLGSGSILNIAKSRYKAVECEYISYKGEI